MTLPSRTAPWLACALALLSLGCGARSEGIFDAGHGDGGRADAGRTDAGRDGGRRDAGAACPADFLSAEGTPCAVEGTTCGGPCTDPCSFCNLLSCMGGVWQRLEAFPAPCFACGDDLQCVEHEQYCRHVLSDVGGVPDDYSCERFPADCGDRSCACLEGRVAFDRCLEDAGQVTVELGGG